MSDSPTVTVLMCAYNSAPYVEETVRSVLGQSFRDYEFLAFDDGSSDGTADVLERLASEDDRLVVHRRPHGNYVEKLNEGLALARGRYIARHDADDVSLPDRFALQVAELDRRPEVVCVGSRMIETDSFGIELSVTDHAPDHETIDAQLMQGNGWAVPQPAAMFRREASRALGDYRRQFVSTEDLDLFLRLAEVGELANLERPLVRYRRHPSSVNSTRAAEQREKVWQIVREARVRRGHRDPDAGGPGGLEALAIRQPPPLELLERWTWNALRRGEKKAARRHALSRLRQAPLSPTSWRIVACATRGW